ncbi:MAG: 4Fe-4S binding protein [Nitrososphaerota archaeon]|nr:4Fe-4S binding protein [Aigarchaeota archaeon]MDW8076087.1 4Fe-4S binding protein [Nitrososphaerota archaeon]
MGMLRDVKRTLMPIYSGLKHVFLKPYTVKWPYEKVPNLPDDRYRFDPKAGIAYPGNKGRHLLYMEKCTGCSSCDLACQNIAEAITMSYGFDVVIVLDDECYEHFKESRPEIVEALEVIASSFSAEPSYIQYNSLSSFFWTLADIRQVTKVEGGYEVKLNLEPIFDARAIEVLYQKVYPAIEKLKATGWEIKKLEAATESASVEVAKQGFVVNVLVRKIDMGYKQNRRSLFPSVDYGRCVMCGFCVDACPFQALEMTNDFELSAVGRRELIYTPIMLAKRPEEFNVTGVPPELNVIERTRMVFRRLIW